MADKNELQEFLDRAGLSHLWSRLKEKLNGKEAAGAAATVQTNLTNHNTDTAAHNDLRLELKALSDRINAALDSDDETLDELSEIVAYIKSNKTLIDAITTSKVSVSDIVNDLLTNVANRPLSAAQGVALKKLIDDLAKTVPAVDDALSASSTNPVQNKVVKTALDGKAPTQFVMTLTYDTSGGTNHSLDKTFAELEAAYQAGSQIRLVDSSGMEYELLAFAAGYMAYFAHQLNADRYIIGIRANNTITYSSTTPFTTSNPPNAAQVGAKGSNNSIRNSGSIKTWALEQTTSTSIGAGPNESGMPETGAYWFVDLIVTSNGLWRKLTATKTNSDGTAPTTYECTCMSDTWSEWEKVYTSSNKPTASDVGAATMNQVNTAIQTAIGNINAILDSINGEVV